MIPLPTLPVAAVAAASLVFLPALAAPALVAPALAAPALAAPALAAPALVVPALVAPALVAPALVAPVLTAPAVPAGDPGRPVVDPGRPVVLMLHGRGLTGSDTASLRRTWRRALDEGIASVAGEPFLDEGDLRLVWYADALDPGASACPDQSRYADGAEHPDAGRHPDGAERPDEGSGRGWARDVGATLGAAGTLMGLVAQWMGGPEGEALEALAGDLVYLGDARRRCGAEERLASALAATVEEGRPVILVAHSFGALVAYHHLRARPGDSPRIERWITVGSLLGHPELREILLAGEGGTGLPAGVGSWVNVRDPRDPLAAPLLGLGAADADAAAIEDRRTENPSPGDPHDPARYLSDPTTARAVLEAWCGAVATAGSGVCGGRGGASARPGGAR